MTLTIISGTHTFIDLTGRFRDAWTRAQKKRIIYDIDGVRFAKHRFDRVEITIEGKVIFYPTRIFPMDRYGISWSVSQPTGSGKTVLAVYHLLKTFRNGGNIQANFSFKHFKHNAGKPKDQWMPSILSIDDFQEVKKCHVVIDDIKGTIERWQAKEADIITLVANTGRKEGVDLDFTTQRVINYMPPNIRAVATGYEIPYITIRDLRKPSPDGKGFPIEMEVFSLIPADSGDVFVGFGCLNKDIPDGKIICPTYELLDSYKTMELATGLKVGKEEGARPNQPGYELEVKALKYLKDNVPGMNWEHLNGKHVFDIISDIHAIDIVGTDPDGYLYLDHKDLSKHIKTANRKGQKPYLMFEYAKEWRLVVINHNLSDIVEGKKINPAHLAHNRMRSVENI